jgi:hypothetical protein
VRVNVTREGDDLLAAVEDAIRALAKGQELAGKAVAKIASKAIKDDVKGARGSLSFSGMSTRSGVKTKLGVKTHVAVSATEAKVTLRGKPAGPWAIVEYGAKEHDITPKEELNDRGRRRALGGGLDAPRFKVRIRKQSGRPYWENATDRLDREIDPVIEGTFDKAMGV